MNELPVHNSILLDLLHGGITAWAIIACCYLLFRRGNAFAPNVASPTRMRHCTATHFLAIALSHVWWVLIVDFKIISDPLASHAIASGIDSIILDSTIMITLVSMLQDKRRPFWPVFVAMLPFVVIITVCILHRSYAFVPLLHVYEISLYALFAIYMVFSTTQYKRWLRDNYADLENKEMWLNFVMLAIMLLVFIVYENDNGNLGIMYLVEVNDFALILLLLLRVETLQQLDTPSVQNKEEMEEFALPAATAPSTLPSNIGQMLEQYCVGTQLYLRHDLSLLQLSEAVGTNHYYLSQYFAQQGTNYNAYINGLRIRHFINLYHEAIANQRPFTAQQLANESGFRSYSTFSAAFKQRMGQTVTSWMRDTAEK